MVLVSTVRVGEAPDVVALAHGLGFVTDEYSGAVTGFHLDTLEQVKRAPGGHYPEGIEANRMAAALDVANRELNTVSVIDSERLAVEHEFQAAMARVLPARSCVASSGP